PNMTVDEWHECDEMLRAQPAVAEALARRGITDMSLVLTDMWAYGAALVPERYKDRRLGWSDVWYRDTQLGNPYAHHVTRLHPVAYADSGRLRSVAHRLSFAEMVVPYRDASPDHYRRTAFDIGEWGLGFMTTSLALGCDCLGDIIYLDAVVHDSRGEPRTIP